jgi:nucleolar pre-ribosomal-associated protein 2
MPTNGPSAIYQRLCSLTSVLLTRFRKRLGGRYHLLLPVLQGLLRCLFRPIPIPVSSKQPQLHHHQPPWLLVSTTEPLASKSATQYTRLLTSLCDPTASSVSSSRHRARLTDDTKKAKSIAGQYMQYLIMEYARCQLQGQLPPEVKTALMPGLYAVLDVIPRDLMRGMNAAMDSSSRAIFKGLYEDYQRFGRWNQS